MRRPSMRPEAIRERQLAYQANYIVLPPGKYPELTTQTGYFIYGVHQPIMKPTALLKAWKASEKRFGMVKFETRASGLVAMFESLGDKMQFEREFMDKVF